MPSSVPLAPGAASLLPPLHAMTRLQQAKPKQAKGPREERARDDALTPGSMVSLRVEGKPVQSPGNAERQAGECLEATRNREVRRCGRVLGGPSAGTAENRENTVDLRSWRCSSEENFGEFAVKTFPRENVFTGRCS